MKTEGSLISSRLEAEAVDVQLSEHREAERELRRSSAPSAGSGGAPSGGASSGAVGDALLQHYMSCLRGVFCVCMWGGLE